MRNFGIRLLLLERILTNSSGVVTGRRLEFIQVFGQIQESTKVWW